MKVRAVSVYYRDTDGVMRAIPNVKVIVIDGKATKVYTLPPVTYQEVTL